MGTVPDPTKLLAENMQQQQKTIIWNAVRVLRIEITST